MKKIILFGIGLICTLTLQAQFVHFGTDSGNRGAIAIGDLNNDGLLDVIYSSGDETNPQHGGVMINNGDKTFTRQAGTRVIRPGNLGDINVGDIDGDGDIDAIFNGWANETQNPDRIGIALNDGTGIFSIANKTSYPNNNKNISCGFSDFNNDGLLDYYFFGNGLKGGTIYFQQADGSFTASTDSFADWDIVDPQVSTIDFDNDGDVDLFINGWLATAKSGYSVTRISTLFLNDGKGSFSVIAKQNAIIAKGFGSAAWGDIDGDGWLDFVLNGDGHDATGEASGMVFRAYKNNQGILESKTTFESFNQGNVGQGSVLFDFNNDGKLDIVLGGYTGSQTSACLYECTEAGSFTFVKNTTVSDKIDHLPSISDASFAAADLNNDGKADIVLMGYNGNGQLNRNISGCYFNNTSTPAYTKLSAPQAPTVSSDYADGVETTFSWEAPENIGNRFNVSYNLALFNKTLNKWFWNPMATISDTDNNGWRKTTGMGNVYLNKTWKLHDLPDGTYQWTVQAIDGAFFGGAFAPKQEFIIDRSLVSAATLTEMPINLFSTSNQLHLSCNTKEEGIAKVYSLDGSLIQSASLATTISFDLPKGIYLVEITTPSVRKTQKAFVQ